MTGILSRYYRNNSAVRYWSNLMWSWQAYSMVLNKRNRDDWQYFDWNNGTVTWKTVKGRRHLCRKICRHPKMPMLRNRVKIFLQCRTKHILHLYRYVIMSGIAASICLPVTFRYRQIRIDIQIMWKHRFRPQRVNRLYWESRQDFSCRAEDKAHASKQN